MFDRYEYHEHVTVSVSASFTSIVSNQVFEEPSMDPRPLSYIERTPPQILGAEPEVEDFGYDFEDAVLVPRGTRPIR